MAGADIGAEEGSAALEKAVVGKILGRLIPFLALLYMFCLLDRATSASPR